MAEERANAINEELTATPDAIKGIVRTPGDPVFFLTIRVLLAGKEYTGILPMKKG